MKTRSLLLLIIFVGLSLVAGCPQEVLAETTQKIALEGALEQAFALNPEHSLFLWEQKLAEKRGELDKHPNFTVIAKPSEIKDGQWQKSKAGLIGEMPLGNSFDLSVTLALEVDHSGINLTPSGTLNLEHSFFKEKDLVQGSSAQDNLRKQENALVLHTLDLLVQLRQQLNEQANEQSRYKFLEASLEAAQLAPNYDELKLKKEIREQTTKLMQINEAVDGLQLRLALLLGAPVGTVYDPVLRLQEVQVDMAVEDYLDELFFFSTELNTAQTNLAIVQSKLSHEQKTGGWDIKAGGSVSLDATWDLGLTASKKLYPRQIILEELELAAAQAEHALATLESTLHNQLRVAVQNIKAAQNILELKNEHLRDAKDEWELRQRQFQAGLVTKLQIEEAYLELQKVEFDYSHSQMVYGQSILSLWGLCGRDLRVLALEIVR